MVFSSLQFVFGFLPVIIILGMMTYKCIRIQNLLLLAASLVFYSCGEPVYIWLFIGTVFFNWLIPLVFSRSSCGRGVQFKRMAGRITIFLDIAILFWFKYAGCIGRSFHLSIGSDILPIGISFYMFQAVSYVADVTLLDKYEAEKNPIHVGLYIAFFPQLIAGPIVRYEEMREQFRNRRMTMDIFAYGCFRFMSGFCKKVLLADSMAVIADKAFTDAALKAHTLTSSFAWLGAAAYMFQIYMDFSGYCDMAIGLGAMFGIQIPENFRNPYRASSIRDFWRRWHITLSVWFRDYVYIPLGGSRKGCWKTVFNFAVVWLFTGFWHGADLTFVLWGAVYGTLILVEKALHIESKLDSGGGLKRIGYRGFTLLVIMFLWVLFRADDIGGAWNYISRMLRFRLDRMDETMRYLAEFKWAFMGCMGLSFLPVEKLRKKRAVFWPVLLLYVVSISYLVKGTFSPFLYFNF